MCTFRSSIRVCFEISQCLQREQSPVVWFRSTFSMDSQNNLRSLGLWYSSSTPKYAHCGLFACRDHSLGFCLINSSLQSTYISPFLEGHFDLPEILFLYTLPFPQVISLSPGSIIPSLATFFTSPKHKYISWSSQTIQCSTEPFRGSLKISWVF